MEAEIEWVKQLRIQIRQRVDPWVVLEGRHAVEGALGGWWDVAGVLAGEECTWDPPQWSGLELLRRPRTELEELAGYAFHRGVIGLAKQPEDTGDVAALMGELGPEAMVVVCPRLTDAANAGAIIRNAAALGAEAVIFGHEGVSPFERKAVRSSAGALFRIPVKVADAGQILRCLKAGGFSLAATTGDKRATDLATYDPPEGRLAVVIGSEADGLGQFWMTACDDHIRIPMASVMDSMNAAAASAVTLWEIRRVREERQ
ncbi:tRNA/rRNA methyltransferase [Haloferula helveola]|uniref:tRNA/rRNA methyltransferase n=1 Tax=Haloferula helveola TaxID=490095 RepID=A0ABM7RIR4_9BACT|nr:tRNA/rRNA methyltransferase [Haloferula helveola]